jgi:hypothetical protein
MEEINTKNQTKSEILVTFFKILVIVSAISIGIKPFFGEKFDYLYVFVVYLMLFLLLSSSKIRKIFQEKFINPKISNKKLVLLVNLIFLVDFYYLGFWSLVISIVLIPVLNGFNISLKENIAKYIFPLVLTAFTLNLIKSPHKLVDYFHPLFVTDELFAWINNKHIFLDYMGQYNSLLGVIFIDKKVKNIPWEIDHAYWYLIILQIVGIFIVYLILKEITKRKIELIIGATYLFSIMGGLVWVNLFSILDFFQELPSRKIFPLLIIYIFCIYLKLEFEKRELKKNILLMLMGLIQGIAIINDYLFSIGVFLSIIATVIMINTSIINKLKSLIIFISTTFATIMSFLLMNYPQNAIPKARVIFAYVWSYGENQFAHEFKIIGPDIFFFSLAIFGIIWSLKNNRNAMVSHDEKLEPIIFLLSLLLCYNALYWMGRSFEIQIVASSGLYSALLITSLYSKSRKHKDLDSISHLLINLVLISPFLFNLLNVKSINNDYLRLFNTTKSSYADFESSFNTGPTKTIEDIQIMERQIDFIINSKIKTKQDIALISDYGNITSAKLGVYNGNILNSPFSITNSFVMEVICKNVLKNKMKYLIFDKRTEKYFNDVEPCYSNFKQDKDKTNAFPRFNFYTKK